MRGGALRRVIDANGLLQKGKVKEESSGRAAYVVVQAEDSSEMQAAKIPVCPLKPGSFRNIMFGPQFLDSQKKEAMKFTKTFRAGLTDLPLYTVSTEADITLSEQAPLSMKQHPFPRAQIEEVEKEFCISCSISSKPGWLTRGGCVGHCCFNHVGFGYE